MKEESSTENDWILTGQSTCHQIMIQRALAEALETLEPRPPSETPPQPGDHPSNKETSRPSPSTINSTAKNRKLKFDWRLTLGLIPLLALILYGLFSHDQEDTSLHHPRANSRIKGTATPANPEKSEQPHTMKTTKVVIALSPEGGTQITWYPDKAYSLYELSLRDQNISLPVRCSGVVTIQKPDGTFVCSIKWLPVTLESSFIKTLEAHKTYHMLITAYEANSAKAELVYYNEITGLTLGSSLQ
ncbi:MAG: hypothetical protein HQM12_11555 [SAR324 cluster bacterium]|nr:hypothetical protein [SAR324 cluster bacterium]